VKVRYQADADLNSIIVAAVLRREPGIDFQTAAVARLAGVEDPDVLSMAADERRVLVTHDGSSMPSHFADFIAQRRSPGLIVVRQNLPIHDAAEQLILIWAATEAEEWIDRIWYVRAW